MTAIAACSIEKFDDKGNAIPEWVVTADSAGPLRIGMPADSALVVLGQPAATMKRERCDYLAIDVPVNVMVVNDTVVRFEVSDTAIVTLEGARVGDPIAKIEQLYAGRIRTQPHKYTNGKYLIVTSRSDSTRQLIFETDSALVTSYRAGRLPEVGWVERCG